MGKLSGIRFYYPLQYLYSTLSPTSPQDKNSLLKEQATPYTFNEYKKKLNLQNYDIEEVIAHLEAERNQFKSVMSSGVTFITLIITFLAFYFPLIIDFYLPNLAGTGPIINIILSILFTILIVLVCALLLLSVYNANAFRKCNKEYLLCQRAAESILRE